MSSEEFRLLNLIGWMGPGRATQSKLTTIEKRLRPMGGPTARHCPLLPNDGVMGKLFVLKECPEEKTSVGIKRSLAVQRKNCWWTF